MIEIDETYLLLGCVRVSTSDWSIAQTEGPACQLRHLPGESGPESAHCSGTLSRSPKNLWVGVQERLICGKDRAVKIDFVDIQYKPLYKHLNREKTQTYLHFLQTYNYISHLNVLPDSYRG